MTDNPHDNPIKTYGHNGWKMWESMPAGVMPIYRWQNSWSDEGQPDIIGFDGTTAIGRVFQIETVINTDIWFWVLYGVENKKRERPGQGSGWEKSMHMAVCRVEWCYERMIRPMHTIVRR